jgi:UDP-N-acetylmuramoyl-tripeptide--D-alanyl-D-alanine ligase
MTLTTIADVVGGSVQDGSPGHLVTGPACYDSRLIEPQGLFAAFAGQNVDGHDFVGPAMAGGEISARHVGDVAYLSRLVRPRVGVVTNIGVSHLSEFGSLEHTRATKAELVDALPADGHAVLNANDARVAAMAVRSAAPVTLYGTSATASVRAENMGTDGTGRASFRLCTRAGSARVRLRLIGEHYVPNALAAAAAVLWFTDDVALIADALSEADRVSAGRMEVIETRVWCHRDQ